MLTVLDAVLIVISAMLLGVLLLREVKRPEKGKREEQLQQLNVAFWFVNRGYPVEWVHLDSKGYIDTDALVLSLKGETVGGYEYLIVVPSESARRSTPYKRYYGVNKKTGEIDSDFLPSYLEDFTGEGWVEAGHWVKDPMPKPEWLKSV